MEIWAKKNDQWSKREFQPFPATEPLFNIIFKHQTENSAEHHWVVFTPDEAEAIQRASKPFFPETSDLGCRFLQKAVGSFLTQCWDNPPFFTVIPVDLAKPLRDAKEFRLAVEFNRSYD